MCSNIHLISQYIEEICEIGSDQSDMESPKFVVVLILAVVTAHGVQSFIFDTNFSFYGRVDDQQQDRIASQGLSVLIANARRTASSTRNRANSVADEINDTSTRFSAIFNANISTTINNIFSPSGSLIETGLSRNDSVADCVEGIADEIAAAINETLLQWEECKLNKINQGLRIVNLLHENCGNATQLAVNVTQGLGTCLRLGNGNLFRLISPQVLACKLRLATTAGTAFANLGLSIARNLSLAKLYLLNLKIELAACGIAATAQAAENASNIAADLAACFTNSTSTG